jgi:hypothetical protein
VNQKVGLRAFDRGKWGLFALALVLLSGVPEKFATAFPPATAEARGQGSAAQRTGRCISVLRGSGNIRD